MRGPEPQQPSPIVPKSHIRLAALWTDARKDVVARAAARLRLTEVSFAEDRRQLFLGHQLDHIYTRGLEVVRSSSIPVKSSDHNPVTATLRVAR